MSFAGCFDNGMSSVRNVCVYRLGYWMEPISWRFTKLNFVWTTYFRLCRWLLRVCTLIYYLFILLGSFFSLLLSVLCVFFLSFFFFWSSFFENPDNSKIVYLHEISRRQYYCQRPENLSTWCHCSDFQTIKPKTLNHIMSYFTHSVHDFVILSDFFLIQCHLNVSQIKQSTTHFFLSLVVVSIDALTFRLG